MMKVNSRKVIVSVAKTTYKANKKKNALTIFAVILTTFLITAVFGIGISYWGGLAERSIRMEGMDYDIELTEPREDQIEKVRNMDAVKYAGVSVKCGIVEEYKGKTLEKVRFYWVDDICWEKQCIPAYEFFEGKYPEKENELVLSTEALKNMGVSNPEIGMELPLTYYALNVADEEGEQEAQQENITKTFTLSGYYRDYSGHQYGYVSRAFYETTGAKPTGFTQGALKITLKNSLYSKKDIMEIQKPLDLQNKQVLMADDDLLGDFMKVTVGLGGLLIMILLSGYLFIYNTLYISVSKDIRYYGQLKTLGMTSVQLKCLVYLQAFWNSCIGIPLGLLLGAGVSAGVVPMALRLVDPSLGDMKIVKVYPLIYMGAAVFASFTVMAGCRKPAVITGECSPVEAVGYTGLAEGKRKPKEGERGLKDMARRNMFRDKKQAAVILGSFFVALTVFLCVNAVVRGNDAKNILNQTSECDIVIKNQTTLEENLPLLTEEKMEELRAVKGVREVRPVSSAETIVPYQEEVFGEYYKRLYESRFSPGNYEKDIEAYKKDADTSINQFDMRMIGISQEGFQIVNKELGGILDQEAFERGETAVALTFFASADEAKGKVLRFSLPKGPKPQEEYQVYIAAVGEHGLNPAEFAGGYSPDILVSNTFAKKIMGDKYYTELLQVDYQEPYSQTTEKAVKEIFQEEKEITFRSKLVRYQEMKLAEQQVKFLGGGLGVILAVLSILNYINMMAAGVQNRAKEFAVLESLGMTSGQIKRVLIQEGLGYGGLSILLSMAAGLPLSFLTFEGVKSYNISFSLPLLSNLVLFAVIIAVCVLVPPAIYQMTQKESVIERLRTDVE